MALGTPVLLGTLVNNSNPASSGTITTTTTANVGDQIVVAVDNGVNTATLSVADSVGNTYNPDISGTRGTLVSCALFRCNVTTQLPSGGTITVTAASAGAGLMAVAAVETGVATGTFDKSTSNSSLSSTPSTGTTAATTNANEIVWAFVADSATSSVLTAPTGYTKIGEAASGTRQADVALFYQVVSATGTQSCAPTTNWGASKQWFAGIATYAAAAGGGSTDDISPATITATSAMSGGIVALRAVAPVTINATSTVAGGVATLRLIHPATTTATSAISATVTRLAAIVTATISATSNMSAAVSKLGTKTVSPASFAATSAMSGSLRALRSVSGSITASSTVTATLQFLRALTGSLAATSDMSAVVTLPGASVGDSVIRRWNLPRWTLERFYGSLTDARTGLRRYRSRETEDASSLSAVAVPYSASGTIWYVLRDTDTQEIVSQHETLADAQAALRRRLSRASQNLSVETIKQVA